MRHVLLLGRYPRLRPTGLKSYRRCRAEPPLLGTRFPWRWPHRRLRMHGRRSDRSLPCRQGIREVRDGCRMHFEGADAESQLARAQRAPHDPPVAVGPKSVNTTYGVDWATNRPPRDHLGSRLVFDTNRTRPICTNYIASAAVHIPVCNELVRRPSLQHTWLTYFI